MIRFIIVLIALVSLAGGGAIAAPLEAYGRLPAIEDVALSSDGKLLALILTDGEQRNVVVHEVATDKRVAVIRAADTKVRYLEWAGPEHLLITVSKTATLGDDVFLDARAEQYTVVLFDVRQGKQRPLVSKMSLDSLNTVVGEPVVRTVNGTPTVYIHGTAFVNGRGRRSLIEATVDSPKSKIIEVGPQGAIKFLVDKNGVPIARSEYDTDRQVWTIFAKRSGEWRELTSGRHAFSIPNLIAPSPASDAILIGMEGDDGYTIRELSLTDGVIRDSSLHKPNHILIFDHNGGVIGGFQRDGEETPYAFLDKRDQAVWTGILRAYPGEIVSLESWSNDRQRIVVLVDSPEAGPAFALVDLTTKKSRWLGEQYGGIRTGDVAPQTAIRYRASDGLEISGYLTTPLGRESKNLPLIVLPHAGPGARNVPRFDWWAQALASQGYAVLQPNFRGSRGFGRQFQDAGDGQVGGKMQSDLSDGVKHLASNGVIDPARVCIVGSDYGGYAALAGVSLEQGVYRCAASYGAYTDLPRLLAADERAGRDFRVRAWNKLFGSSGPADPRLKEISPAMKADAVVAPVLLMHGKDDTVVLYEQSRIMAEAMTKAGKPVQFVTLEGEDHWLSRGATRQKMLVELVAFLKAHNPPD